MKVHYLALLWIEESCLSICLVPLGVSLDQVKKDILWSTWVRLGKFAVY